MVDSYSLYFHVPFCTRKCDYCHFYVIPDKEPFKIAYMAALYQEWAQKLQLLKDKELVSIYFGGGTPFLLGPERIATILQWIPHISSVEITLEANPEHTTLELLKRYREAGINRLSIGIQSFDEKLLKLLGRAHTPFQAKQAVEWAYEVGIHNLSIDLMYDLPGQTLEDWNDTLEQALSLPITHLSLYNLTIEPHTVFYKKRSELAARLPNPEVSLQMLELAIEKLLSKGFCRYEISAFAKEKNYSLHNSGYWTGRPFLGLGPSAYSFWGNSRFRNIAHLNRYCKLLESNRSPVDFSETLPEISLAKELIAIRLRLTDSVPLEQFSLLPSETQTTLKALESQNLVVFDEQGFRLTQKGLLFHDFIASEIID